MRVLIVDDESRLRKTLAEYIRMENWDVGEASNGLSAQKILSEAHFDAIALDLRMPGMDGQTLLKWLMNEGPAIPTVVMSAYGDVGDAVTAMKAGAVDYLVKPFDPAELVIRLQRAAAIRSPARTDTGVEPSQGSELSRDPAMKPLLSLLDKAAGAEATILITGESGTGKEVAARYIHSHSARADGPFVAVNLGGLPEGLVESELFGYEKGAFTGAESRKVGLFETAASGTLFLDEIGDLAAPLQVKILRALQERKIQRLGGIGVIPVDTRIITATNRNLEKLVTEGLFREDLFYRINVVRVALPPLRERPSDIAYLANLFLKRLRLNGRTTVQSISNTVMEALQAYPFPGNIRELENLVERAVILADSETLQIKDFALPDSSESSKPMITPTLEAPATLKEMEIQMIRNTLLRNEGRRESSAQELGISRKTLRNKMLEYNIQWDKPS